MRNDILSLQLACVPAHEERVEQHRCCGTFGTSRTGQNTCCGTFETGPGS